MGIDTTKSFADIAEGTQVTGEIADSIFDEFGRFGAEMELSLDILTPEEHRGETIMSSFSLSQPRLRKVRDLREDGIDDAAIAEVLRKKGFEFEKIDEPETPKLGGALLRIVKACYGNDSRAVKKLLAGCDTFDALAEELVGKRFVFTTRKDKNEYTRVDGKGEFYRVMPKEAAKLKPVPQQADDPEEDFEDIPF
jgi:hypothetical protein